MGRVPAALLLLLIGLAMPAPRAATGQAPFDYEVKAAFVYQFVRFVEWPEGVVTGPLRICVAGEDVFRGALDAIVRGELVNGHPVVVHPIPYPERGCHVLYVSDRASWLVYLRAVRDSPVLTIGESPSFLAEGGIIRLFRQGDNIRFEVNLDAAERVGVRLSTRLIQLARQGGA